MTFSKLKSLPLLSSLSLVQVTITVNDFNLQLGTDIEHAENGTF